MKKITTFSAAACMRFLCRKTRPFLLAVVCLCAIAAQAQRLNSAAMRKLQLAEFAIARLYVDTVNENRLVEDAIVGMLGGLDPHSTYSDADEVKEGAILEREKKLRGLIFLGGRFDYSAETLAPVGVPFVCCTYTNCFGSLDEKDYSSVSIDDYMTAFQAVKTLIDLGHRRIAVVAPATNDRSISELRYKGYRAAMEQSGLEFDPSLLAETEGCFEMPQAYRGTEKLIDGGGDFTALFALSDTTALAAMKALEDHGRKVPEDCSVIGIDGLSVSEYANPTLTTMVQPVEEMGRQSVAILADMIEQRRKSCHLRLEACLRPGGSVRKN